MEYWKKDRILRSEDLKNFFVITSYNTLKKENQHLDNKKVVIKTKEYLYSFEQNITDHFFLLSELVQEEDMLEEIKKQSWELIDLITELKHCLRILKVSLENENLENEIDNIRNKCKREGIIDTPATFYKLKNAIQDSLDKIIFNHTNIN